MKILFSYSVGKNEANNIVLRIGYCSNDKSKQYEFTYTIKALLDLIRQQGKINFMQYQFRYICNQIPNIEAKDNFMKERENIRKEILKLI